jgi:hypothetical protein
MTDQIALQLGARPWLPSRSVRLVRELNYYDMPTEGILKRRFRPSYYFFACIDGAASEYSLWAYCPITRREARRLKHLVADELRAFEVGILIGRSLIVATASESSGLLHQAKVQVRGPLQPEEPKLARQAWQTVNEEIKAEAGAVARMAVC